MNEYNTPQKRAQDLTGAQRIKIKMSGKKDKKRPRRFILKLYNSVDKFKFTLNFRHRCDLTIVSGADSSHFKSLVQFIRSALYYERCSKLVIYDLGLTEEEADFIKNSFPKVVLRIFDYSKYPPYFNIKVNAGQFAWKPVILYDVLNDFKCSTIWLDAGCLITLPLYRIRDVINERGFYSPTASGTIQEWTHPKTIEYLNVHQDLLNKRILAGGIVAVDFNCSQALRLVEKWKECALVKECTVPKSYNRDNHRAQSILSILAYQLGFAQKIPQRYLGFKIHQDID